MEGIAPLQTFDDVEADVCAPCDVEQGRKRSKRNRGRRTGADWILELSHATDCLEKHEWSSIIPRKGCSSSVTCMEESTCTAHQALLSPAKR